jgi:GT2 family glycosyltransferase
MFDEDFFNSYEDYDLFWRARKEGLKTVYTNTVCFQHKHSFTQQFAGFKGTEQNRELFKKKHGEDADILMQKLYPDQWQKDYWSGFDIS